jgi:hypothetical protein
MAFVITIIPALGGAVRDRLLAAHDPPAGCAVHDRARPSGDHVRERELGHQERALEARVHLGIPLVLGATERVVLDVDPGVVEQHVEPPERIDGLPDRALAVVRPADVGRDEDGSAPGRVDLLLDLAAAVRVATDHGDGGAFVREQDGGGPADARGRPRDQRHLAVQPHRVAPHAVARP